MDVLETHIRTDSPEFRAQPRPDDRARRAELRDRLERGAAGRRRAVRPAPSRAGQAAGARADRAAARSGLAVPRALAAGRLGHVRQRRARRRPRHRHRPRLRPRSRSSSPTTPRSRAAPTTRSPSRSTCARSRSRSRTGCRASTWSTPAARSCRCRPRSSPTASTSAASSSTRRACRPKASRRSPS